MSHDLMAGLIIPMVGYFRTRLETHIYFSCVQSVHPKLSVGTEGGNHAAESRGAADDAKFGPGLCILDHHI